MGLIKSKPIKGFQCEYWRLIQLNCNADRKDAVATFALYKDKATRDADASAVVDTYQIDLGEDYHKYELDAKVVTRGEGDKIKAVAYEVFKTKALVENQKDEFAEGVTRDESLAFFSDATDI